VIQNKYLQKKLLEKSKIPQPKFIKVSPEEGFDHFPNGFVQKTEKGGYDGKGVIVIKNKKDLKKASKEESYLEELVDFKKEIAVNVAQNAKGEIVVYPVTEMAFNEELNLCDTTITPAQISEKAVKLAKKIAKKTIKALPKNSFGIFAVEMFLTKDEKVLVNEIAPRPHNSAHYSIEGCYTSQFEQHIRAVCNLPLGSPDLITPSVMVNILGQKNYKGAVKLEKISKLLEIDGLNLHIYGKKESRPGRKIGHLTILDLKIKSALKKAKKAKKLLS
jgi:5-(carboxyamino)imidazole ribonucleotide synthase